jgi:hypothetical protein
MAPIMTELKEVRMASTKSIERDPEITAISLVYSALKDLNPDSQQRVINYVSEKLNLKANTPSWTSRRKTEAVNIEDEVVPPTRSVIDNVEEVSADELEGISPVAIKWMRRNDLTAAALSTIFSLGIEDIDLVAKKVPGDNKIKRVRSVFLLKGIAAYLSTGAARITHQQVKEACLHYDAYDPTNFAKYIKTLSAEISGTKNSGYVLTSRGITSATELIKEMIGSKDS